MERIIDKTIFVVTVTHVYDGYIKTEVSYFKTEEKARKRYQRLLKKYSYDRLEYEKYKCSQFIIECCDIFHNSK